jgi:hypothetical protein
VAHKTRYVAWVAVVGIHAVIIGVFFSSSRAVRPTSSTNPSMTALILRRAVHPHTPIARPRLGEASAPLAPIVERVTLIPAPPAVIMNTASQAIDWNASTKSAVATVLRYRKPVTFGFPIGTSPIMRGAHAPQLSGHHPGDAYRIEGGESIEWVSARCYIASDPPAIWEPQILERARVTHIVCLPPNGPSPGKLFRSLPAYKKYHPQE